MAFSSLSIHSFLSLHPFPSTFKPLRSPKPLLPPPHSFLTPSSFRTLRLLESFSHSSSLPSGGLLHVRLMRPSDLDATVLLLAESFSDSLLFPTAYLVFLSFLIRQYVLEKRNVLPHAATLVGYYREEDGDGEGRFAATAEVSFDERGANANPPTPVPPRDCGYICNMTVKKELRRRGIGRQLLKACETLISQICPSRTVYLHCRLIDTGPLDLYKKAGYVIFQTDNIFVWLKFQRRKHLMRKELPPKDDVLIPDDAVLETSSNHPCEG